MFQTLHLLRIKKTQNAKIISITKVKNFWCILLINAEKIDKYILKVSLAVNRKSFCLIQS